MIYACAHELANLAGTGVHAQMLKDSEMSKRPNTGNGDEGVVSLNHREREETESLKISRMCETRQSLKWWKYLLQ